MQTALNTRQVEFTKVKAFAAERDVLQFEIDQYQKKHRPSLLKLCKDAQVDEIKGILDREADLRKNALEKLRQVR